MTEKVTVAAMDASQKNSPVSGPVSDEATVMMDQAAKVCHWNGQEFPDGQIVVSEGVEYECSFGQWIEQG